MSGPVALNVVTALAVEAKPIVDAWLLKRIDLGPFTMYEGVVPGPRYPVRLIVTGVGRTASAGGVAWLAAHQETPLSRTVWINYGVAGAARISGRDAAVGDVVLATTVVDEERRRAIEAAPAPEQELAPVIARGLGRVPTWYPPWIPAGSTPSLDVERAPVRTVDRPELEYLEDGVYEMEAAGFIETALRFSSAEFVQVAKVVSDTPSKGIASLDALLVRRCSEQGIPALSALAAHLAALMEALPSLPSTSFDAFLEASIAELRLSVAQSHQWRAQLARLVALGGADGEQFAQTELERLELTDRRSAVATLRSAIDALAIASHQHAAPSTEGSP